MTLGKIERFWKTIWDEFLNRCQFDSLESAQQRIALWVKYYNHRRPHQGIGGLCPADRFFEIDSKLRQVIEKGIEENALELALRGRPKENFYMVGRMNGQSVVLEAEKGKGSMTLTVDERLDGKFKEELANENKDNNSHDQRPNNNDKEEGSKETSQTDVFSRTEVPCSTVPVELEPERPCYLPGSGDKLQPAGQVADAGLRSDGECLEAESERIQPDSIKPENSATAGPDRGAGVPLIEEGAFYEQSRSQSSAQNECNPKIPFRRNNSHTGSSGAECESQDFSQLGEPGSDWPAPVIERQAGGPSGEGVQPLRRGGGEEECSTSTSGSDAGTGKRNTRHSPRRTSPRFRRQSFRGTKKKY